MIWFVLAFGLAAVIGFRSRLDKWFDFGASWALFSIMAAIVGLGFGASQLGTKWENVETEAIVGDVVLETRNGENFYEFKTSDGEKVSLDSGKVTVTHTNKNDARYAVNSARPAEWWTGLLRPYSIIEDVAHIYIPADRFSLGS